jgi:hypothetical protein
VPTVFCVKVFNFCVVLVNIHLWLVPRLGNPFPSIDKVFRVPQVGPKRPDSHTLAFIPNPRSLISSRSGQPMVQQLLSVLGLLLSVIICTRSLFPGSMIASAAFQVEDVIGPLEPSASLSDTIGPLEPSVSLSDTIGPLEPSVSPADMIGPLESQVPPFDIAFPDINGRSYEDLAGELGKKRLSTVDGPVVFPVKGVLYGFGSRPFLPLAVSSGRQKSPIHVLFLVATTAPTSFLRKDTLAALGFEEGRSSATVDIHGVRLPVEVSTRQFAHVDVLGQDFFRKLGGAFTINYRDLTCEVSRAPPSAEEVGSSDGIDIEKQNKQA